MMDRNTLFGIAGLSVPIVVFAAWALGQLIRKHHDKKGVIDGRTFRLDKIETLGKKTYYVIYRKTGTGCWEGKTLQVVSKDNFIRYFSEDEAREAIDKWYEELSVNREPVQSTVREIIKEES